MNSEIRNLEPKVLWNKFADLNAIPRPSKKEERVIAFMLEFGHNLGLETFTLFEEGIIACHLYQSTLRVCMYLLFGESCHEIS